MPPINVTLLLLGAVLAVLLIALGYWIGRIRRTARSDRKSGSLVTLVDDDDRQRMVGLLQGLARWTQEYSGNVSNYQADLQQISQDVRQSMAVARGDRSANGGGHTGSAGDRAGEQQTLADTRMLALISQIMGNNEQLQKRLDAAEKQLDEQTQQIESYLTEARTDGLTGLSNRRAFDKKLDELFSNYRGGGSSFVLILIDIDHFKSINDTHGHPVGDVVLQRLATWLTSLSGKTEMVARFGGEEFAILTRSPIRQAAKLMNEVRKKIADESIQTGTVSVKVTMSVGISEPRDDLVIGPIVRRADEALYAAKNRGRDRVYFNDGSGPTLFGAPEVTQSR